MLTASQTCHFLFLVLAHNMGGDMTGDEISNVNTVAYSVGDCETSNAAHHGTPSQRKCATIWGASMSDSKDGQHLNMFELATRFDTWFARVDDMDEYCDHPSSSASSNTKNFVFLLSAPFLIVSSTIWTM